METFKPAKLPKWADTCTKGDRMRALACATALEHMPHLMDYLFHPEKAQLRMKTEKVVEAGGKSGGEKVLIRFCVDLWNGGAKLPFLELSRVDDYNFHACMKAMTVARLGGFL